MIFKIWINSRKLQSMSAMSPISFTLV